MRARIFIILTLSWALLGSCGGGGGSSQPDPSTTQYTLTGTVVDASGAAIVGAQVLLGQSTTETNASGSFSFSNLPAGYYLASVQDQEGNFTSRQLQLSASVTSFSFTLPATPSGFEVVGVSPLLNSTGNVLNSNITITFSDPLDASTLADVDSWFSPEIDSVTVSYETGSTELVLDPELQLPLGQQITVELPTSLASSSGANLSHVVRWRFRTASSDTAAPQLITSTPVEGSTSHAPNLSVVFEFNEKLDTDTGLIQAVSVPSMDITPVISGRYLYIQPTDGWTVSTAYTLTVSGVTDTAGNDYGSALALTFTTAAEASPSNDIQPCWNNVDNTIVFASDRYDGYDIYQVSLDDGALIRLTALPGNEQHPAVSSDGQLLAYQQRETGGYWNIFVQSMDSSDDPVQLTASEYNDQQPSFSNTLSNELVFTSDRSDPTGLYLMNSDGSNLRQADQSFSSYQAYPAFHPLLDTQILFVSNRSGNADIWRKTISAVDGSTININLTSDYSSDETMPVFSADAGTVYYVSDYSGYDELWLAEADGLLPRQLTYFESEVSDPALNQVSDNSECVVSLPLSAGGRGLALVDIVSGELIRWITGGEDSD